MSRLAIVTCNELPEPDVDQSLLSRAFSDAGIQTELVAWDNPAVDWTRFDLAVIRSTWNYPELPTQFKGWILETKGICRILNPPHVLMANIDKHYLADLQASGVETVPTVFPHRSKPIGDWIGASGFPIVIKPTVSAGSWLTEKFTASQLDQAAEFLESHWQERDMMIQPYLDSVESGGEVAWVWIDGQVTHGVRKAPRFSNGFESVSQAVEPSTADCELVERIVAHVGADFLYARIDLMRSGDRWLLSELELIEPSLFFHQHRPALDRFVRAVSKRL